jgi:Ser/Thr protein kinase RdoA (MazF antagonist)
VNGLTAGELLPWSGDVSVHGPVGVHRDVHRVRLDGQPVLARRSRRDFASLDWELDLLEFLAANGVLVPCVVPTADGARHHGGLVITRPLEARAPASEADWDAVADELTRLYECTMGWPPRPGTRSARELLGVPSGGDVDLSRMPPAAVKLVRAAWELVPSGPYPVVHGDPGPGSVGVVDGRVALSDWDRARVDSPWFDLAELPVRRLPDGESVAARAAAHAWETADRWLVEPAYARWRLGLLDAFLAVHHTPPGMRR